MSSRFEELVWSGTALGEISLRRRRDPANGAEVHEVKLDDEFLMSSGFVVAGRALAELGLRYVHGEEIDVVVGGLGLGCTRQRFSRTSGCAPWPSSRRSNRSSTGIDEDWCRSARRSPAMAAACSCTRTSSRGYAAAPSRLRIRTAATRCWSTSTTRRATSCTRATRPSTVERGWHA